ncbi:YlbL family protein [Frigoribacterium faeni]|uniref:YlbL family protein n=1 Tax=Frigoribacterium faeni TaxID=145483 RepID=UPI00353152F2
MERTDVAFFTPPTRASAPSRRPGRIGWSLLGVALVAGLALTFLPSPYLIEQPGPVFDTLGSAEYEGSDQPLITVSGAETYPTAGTLDLLTVSVQGNESVRPSWVEVVAAWFDPSRAVVPVEAIYPSGVTNEQVDEQNAVDMQNSQKSAIAAAMIHDGYSVPSTVTVSQISAGSPAEGVLREGDVVTSVNGTSLEADGDVDTLRRLVAENGVDKAAEIVVDRAGASVTESVTPQEVQNTPLLGVGVSVDYDFPFDVTLKLDQVGGPSAGMMFALGIIDKTTPGELNGGEKVAGTGTITASGQVGPIGGIRQKLYGARDAGATVFLAPSENCDEVVGNVPGGLDVYSVDTLDDAVTALETVADGGDTSSLPTCTAG